MKKRRIIGSCIGGILLLAGGIAFGINRYQYSKNIVDVIPVEMLSSDWGFEQEGNSGMVTNSMSQEIVPNDDQTVKKIYVKEGQKVKIGDKILAYDMAKKKLELELKGYDVKEIEFSIKRAEKELSDLKKGKVSGSSGSGTSLGRRDPFLASLFLRSNETADTSAAGETTTGTDASTENTDSTTADSPTTTQPETTTENPGTTEQQPESTTTYYKVLDEKSEPYKEADGYYYYLCSGDDCIIRGSFINMIRKKNYNVVLQISVNGEIHNVLTLYGSQEDQKNPNQEWRVDSYQTGVEVGDPNDPDNTNSDNTTEPGNGGGHDSLPGGDDWGGGNDVTYTKEELKAMIAEKETDLADLRLDLREAKLEYDTMEKEVKDGTITAVINGIVKEVRDPDEASAEGSAVVTVSSEGNLYVKGTVDEFSYGSLKKGAVVTANSWETGNTFEAKVTEISPYPVGNANYSGYGTGNPNVSYYPFTAVIEDPPEEISNGESVTLSFNKNEAVNTEGAIYLPLAYVRTENNKSYVYVQGKDKKLEKRYITTGQTLYNYVIEIKSGIKSSDSIAFPYGKIVKEGAKTKTADDESDIVY